MSALFRVEQILNPYPLHYRMAFAFSDITSTACPWACITANCPHFCGGNRGYHSPLIQHDDLGSACSPGESQSAQDDSITSCPYPLPFGSSVYSCLSLVSVNDVYQQFKYFNRITILSSLPVWH
jgi:hypothetical protein